MADTKSGEDRAPRPALRAEHATAAFVVLALASVIAAFAWSWHVEHAVSALPGEAGSEALQAGLRDLTDNCLTNSTIEGPLRRHCARAGGVRIALSGLYCGLSGDSAIRLVARQSLSRAPFRLARCAGASGRPETTSNGVVSSCRAQVRETKAARTRQEKSEDGARALPPSVALLRGHSRKLGA